MTAKLFYRLVDAAAEKVYRAATTLGPAVGRAVLDGMAKSPLPEQDDDGCFPDGSPHCSNTSHSQWEAYYGNR